MAQLLEAVHNRILLSDGGMGTQLQRSGLEPGGCGESWNIEHPARILAIHSKYVEAGSDCLITNTFGASSIMLGRHDQKQRVREINRQGAIIARQAFGDGDGFVLGDIGPFGGLMEPYGEFSKQHVYDSFLEQAEGLISGGVDAVIIETQTSLEELGIAIEAAKDAGAPCIIGSVAFDLTRDETDLKTMMGVSPEDAAQFMDERNVDILGVNCGSGVDSLWAARAIERYKNVTDRPTMAQPNAGQPTLENLRVVYRQTPEEMGEQYKTLLNAEPNIVGGCCGTGPEHIRIFRQLVSERNC